MKKISCLILVFLFFIPGLSESGIYKWKDDAGKTHYTDSPNKIPAKYRNKDKVEKKSEQKVISNGVPAKSGKKFPQKSEVAKDKTSFTLTTWKGKKVKIKDFEVGYWKEGSKKFRKGNSVPAKVGYKFGAVFTILNLGKDDSLSITLLASAPMIGYDGETQEFGSSNTVSGNYKNETKEISIIFDKRMLAVYEIPGKWHLSFKNEQKVFRAQKVRITKSLETKPKKEGSKK